MYIHIDKNTHSLSTHIARSAPPRPPGVSRWSHYTGLSGSGTSPSSPWTHLQYAARRRSSPSACCHPASVPPYRLATTGWWAWVSLKQGTPAPLCHPRGPPEGTCPGVLSGWGELRKRKTEEGLIWGSRKSAGGVRANGRLGEEVAWRVWGGAKRSIQVAMAMKLSLSNIHSLYGRTMRTVATAMANSWDQTIRACTFSQIIMEGSSKEVQYNQANGKQWTMQWRADKQMHHVTVTVKAKDQQSLFLNKMFQVMRSQRK